MNNSFVGPWGTPHVTAKQQLKCSINNTCTYSRTFDPRHWTYDVIPRLVNGQ
ncbi:hypothetical protein DPMN_029489 [Dreissena polymorpha]|uniref:Uncharacterized protein n=1 Tax=Dreissena polymorpha TaxID=45954 RepID=A0A9D4M0Y0_DREPO|nr:hypothetical protein DPMN_029489 [Dreissena polymorpha]